MIDCHTYDNGTIPLRAQPPRRLGQQPCPLSFVIDPRVIECGAQVLQPLRLAHPHPCPLKNNERASSLTCQVNTPDPHTSSTPIITRTTCPSLLHHPPSDPITLHHRNHDPPPPPVNTEASFPKLVVRGCFFSSWEGIQ